MENKHCIVIDNSDRKQELRYLKRKLKKNYSFNLIETQINPSDSEYQVVQKTDNSLIVDINKIIQAIESVEFFKRADVIAVDFNLAAGINGFDIIQKIRDLGYKRKKEILLYSAGIDRAIEYILEAEDFNEKKRKIKQLVNANINFLKVEQFSDEIIGLIKKVPSFDFDSEVVDWLYKFKNQTFINSFPAYQGELFQEIAEQIERGTPQSIHFKKQLIEQIFSMLIDLNEIET